MAEMKKGMLARDAGMNRMKKGIMFTIAVMVLSISLLSFAVALAQQSARNSHTAVQLLEIDQATDTYSNMEDALVKIMSSSMNMSVRNNTVLFNASLPALAQTATDMDSFAEFEANQSDLSLSMNLTNLKSLSFIVQPNQSFISQDTHNFHVTPWDASSVRAYDVNLTFPTASIDAAAWQALAESSDPDALPVHIRVQDASYAVNLDFYATLDRYSTSLLNITQAGNLIGTVQFSPPGVLQVWHSGNIGLKASVGFTTPVYVEANDTISVVSAANRTGKIRIA